MPFVLEDLVVNRVDLVDEGANSAAFIKIFKRKETIEPMDISEIISKMKPEHADVINKCITQASEQLAEATATIAKQSTELKEANDALAKANAELDTLKSAVCTCDGEADENGICKACGKPKKKKAGFDETEVLKAMPEAMRDEFLKMRAQKEAAEEQVRKDAEDRANAEAVAKAATLKALPIDQEHLVDIIKKSDETIIDALSTVAAAIDSTVLAEIGKSGSGKGETDAWAEIEGKATEIAKRDSVTKQKAITIAIRENPELYREYLNGGKS